MMSWWALLFAASELLLPSADTTWPAARATWRDGQLVEIRQPQGFRRALLDSGLLGELNRYRWSPKTRKGAFDPLSVPRFWVGDRYALAFDDRGQIRYALLRYSVPVDGAVDPNGGWSPARLARRTRRVESLKAWLNLVPAERDRYGNVFVWAGRTKNAQARLRYVPARDELLLLMRF